MIYGPPDEIIRNHLNSTEIWLYNRIPGNIEIVPVSKQMQFIFADKKGFGWYEQIYSSEVGEKIDPRVYKSLLN